MRTSPLREEMTLRAGLFPAPFCLRGYGQGEINFSLLEACDLNIQ